jgi:hypothetical protein
MSATELRQSFRRRFRAVARQIWSLHVGRGLARTVIVAALLVAVVATADYFLELSWPIRAGLLAGVATVVAVLTGLWVVRPALAWNRERVAAELEGLFPRLGQRVRTAAQHGERSPEELAQDGVAPGLVAALEAETAEKAKPLPFQAALPVRPVLITAAVAVLCVSALVAVAALVPEWRTAVTRVGLAPTPYTNLTATASADTVDEGTDVDIRATVSGRTRPEVVLHVRETGDAEWRQETMETGEDGYKAKLSRLRATTEFFVVAGPERTAVQTITVRHALKIAGSHAEITSPAYTGVAIATYESGSCSAIQGSTAKLRFELDRAPVGAALVIKDPARPKDPPRRVEMTVQDRIVSVGLPLEADMEYTVEARDSVGMPLALNRHRIRVTADQSPTVWFETPGESMEVHTLAEVLIRARARDDFGLSKLAIVFQVNNEEERTLVLYDVTEPNQREAKAEQMILLEQFLLTQKDCVAYYAFAEDARPDGVQRTTTELRFIDIRPFQRIYRLLEPGEPMVGGGQRDFIFLDEVIARQRFNLNQTMRLEARSKVRLDLAQVERIAAFENKLATQTHDLADFLIERAVDGGIILQQAEEAMLSAVDSLNAGKFGTAINQQRDALRFLMEARDTVQQAIMKQPRAIRAQARQLDRFQRQKLRRPNDQVDTLLQIADELKKLADEEDQVARQIAGNLPGGMSGGTAPKDTPMPKDGDPKVEPKNGKGRMDPAQEKQDEIAGQATGIEKVAADAKGLTPLAKTRIGEATKAANAAADALGQGDRPTARTEVDKAREMFRNAAKQVAALAADEAAQQLAAARDIANDIALRTAPPVDPKAVGIGNSGEATKLPGLGDAAEQAKTLKDLLENLAGSTVASDAEAARKAGGILKSEDLDAAIQRLKKPGAGDDKGERQDLADRFAALGQKLDQAYRETIAPRLEEIAKLEREANDLEQRAGAAADAADWRRLQRQGTEFIERLNAAGLANLASEDLQTALKGGVPNGELFRRGIAATHTRLVAKLQDFIAGDRLASGNEAVPPEYRDLVERYLRALSAGGSK